MSLLFFAGVLLCQHITVHLLHHNIYKYPVEAGMVEAIAENSFCVIGF